MPRERPYELSARQREVVELLAEGFTVKEIGAGLSISPRTVEKYLLHIRYKLGTRRTREIPAAYYRITGESPFRSSVHPGRR
jgi:DNA-binding CsgD family transcriptional regulator